jgi:hypothetical protein
MERNFAKLNPPFRVVINDHGWLVTGAASSIFVAGVLHLIAAPQHWGHAPPHGVTLALIGMAQIVWAAAFWYHPSNVLSRLGIMLAGGLLVLWGFTRVFTAPFHPGPESIQAIDVAVKLAELSAILSLSALIVHQLSTRAMQASAWRQVWWSLVVALWVGTIAYGLSLEAVALLPGLGHAAEHTHGH